MLCYWPFQGGVPVAVPQLLFAPFSTMRWFILLYHMGLTMQKRVIGHMRTAKAQIRLRSLMRTIPVRWQNHLIQSSQRSTLPPERPMNGERPERNRDRTGTGTTGTERPSVPFLAFLAFSVVPVHSSEKMERCLPLLKLSCYQTKRNLTFKTIQSDHSSRSTTYSKTVLS